MRATQLFLDSHDIRVAEVSCRGAPRAWSEDEAVARPSIVLVRSGLFRRQVDGREIVVDAMTAYIEAPGSVQRFAHPCGGDMCTVIEPTAAAVESLSEAVGRGNDHVIVPAELDLHHRMLLARARRGADAFELLERASVLAGELLRAFVERTDGPPAGTRAEVLAAAVRELLTEDLELGLDELARRIGISPFHLSRSFRRATGMTLTRYRRQLRLRSAFQRLSAGDSDLARLAVELGFADQAHFTRVCRAEAGVTPGELRAFFSAGANVSGPR